MQQVQLQRIFKFTTDDLKANRTGTLSESQVTKNEPPKPNKLVFIVIIGHALVIGGILGAIAIATGEMALWIVLAIVVAMGLMPFVMMGNEGNINPAFRNDIEAGKVRKVCGMVIVHKIERENRTPKYELYIDGLAFQLSTPQAGAFVSEKDYCIYYLPLSKKILSAEPQLD